MKRAYRGVGYFLYKLRGCKSTFARCSWMGDVLAGGGAQQMTWDRGGEAQGLARDEQGRSPGFRRESHPRRHSAQVRQGDFRWARSQAGDADGVEGAGPAKRQRTQRRRWSVRVK